MRRIAALIVVVLLLGSACGDDDAGPAPEAPALDPAAQEAADSLADTLGDLSDADLITYLTGDSADLGCWAERLVGSLGADGAAAIMAAATEAELEAALAALSGGDRDLAADGLAACVDQDALLAEVTEYLERDVARCAIDQMLGTSNFREVFTGWVTGDDAAVGEIEAAVGQTCGM